MRSNFSLIFWGLLLVLLDFSVNGIDVLPDGIGYILAAAGCAGLARLSQRFKTAIVLCFVLAALWLFGFGVRGEIVAAYGLITTVVNCAMIWQLLGGISEFARRQELSDMAQRAENRRITYVAIMMGSLLLSYALSGSRNAAPLAFVIVAAMLVLMVMILHLIHRVKVELAG